MQTLQSEYLLTNNSILQPAPLAQAHLLKQHVQDNEYIDRLSEKLVQLQEEVEMQRSRAEEHKKAYYESKKQINVLKQLSEENERKQMTVMSEEMAAWEQTVQEMRRQNEHELYRKQSEIIRLHEVLADWID